MLVKLLSFNENASHLVKVVIIIAWLGCISFKKSGYNSLLDSPATYHPIVTWNSIGSSHLVGLKPAQRCWAQDSSNLPYSVFPMCVRTKWSIKESMVLSLCLVDTYVVIYLYFLIEKLLKSIHFQLTLNGWFIWRLPQSNHQTSLKLLWIYTHLHPRSTHRPDALGPCTVQKPFEIQRTVWPLMPWCIVQLPDPFSQG